ncbi:DNRLRE domain-containing protein [Ilyomonas limi]|uniref:DNRLRE domain-containing protein n=1 Tax=Ilyomonas limi TaxID=2575867 RepID=A0A4U3KW83_9BACT|nr:DNRLRE domain-containing protein [Ilyomonas limi]TKK66670.1 DNRLRE domain-containing protein [Ilyomonas limi]
MKNVAPVYCILVCSLFALFSCTKNTEDVNAALIQNKAGSRLLNASNVAIIDYMPGDSLVVKGDTSNGDETVLLHSGYGGISRPDFPSFTALSNGFGGIDGRDRSIMKFKLRGINDSLRNNPPQIQKAVLYLYQYHRPADKDPYTIAQNGDNSVELHRVVGDWEPGTINWSNQPTLARGSANPLEDVVIIPPVVTPLPAGTNDDQVVDVTDMVRKIITAGNYKGFLLKLTRQGEFSYFGRAYGSFTCPIESKRPKLILYF